MFLLLHAESMPHSYNIVFFVLSILVLLSGWLLHSRILKKKIDTLCEQVARDQYYISLLNTILHDILNPVVAAKYCLENLKAQAPRELFPYIEKSMNSIGQLSLLIERVRDMRAFDSGKKSLQFTKIGVNKVLSMVENTFKDRVRAKGIRLIVRKDRSRSYVEIDPIIFSSYVLNNIVDNSIKFSKGGTFIEIAGYPIGSDIEFFVKDQGSGMTEDTVNKFMEGKYEEICSNEEGPKGMGIGMRQVAKYLELAGGSVHVESRTAEQSPYDHGTTYRVKIPGSQNPRTI